MDITTLRSAQTDTSISPVGPRSGLGVIGNKDGATAGDMAPSISSGNRHIHGHGSGGIGNTTGKKTVNEITHSNTIEEKPSESMSQISGFRRTLSHTNSLAGGDHTPVPKFGVNAEKESELAEVRSR